MRRNDCSSGCMSLSVSTVDVLCDAGKLFENTLVVVFEQPQQCAHGDKRRRTLALLKHAIHAAAKLKGCSGAQAEQDFS
jgi:hypothetical protein